MTFRYASHVHWEATFAQDVFRNVWDVGSGEEFRLKQRGSLSLWRSTLHKPKFVSGKMACDSCLSGPRVKTSSQSKGEEKENEINVSLAATLPHTDAFIHAGIRWTCRGLFLGCVHNRSDAAAFSIHCQWDWGTRWPIDAASQQFSDLSGAWSLAQCNTVNCTSRFHIMAPVMLMT